MRASRDNRPRQADPGGRLLASISATNGATGAISSRRVSMVPAQDIEWLVTRLRAVVMAGPTVCREMTLPQLTALHFIAALAPVSLTKLAQALETKPPATSAMVDRLIQARLVCRTPDPRDGRRVELNLTTDAQQVVGHTNLRAARRLRTVISGMSPEARHHLIDVLIDKMTRSPRIAGLR